MGAHEGARSARVPSATHIIQEKSTSEAPKCSQPIDATPVLESKNLRTDPPPMDVDIARKDNYITVYNPSIESAAKSIEPTQAACPGNCLPTV